VRTYNVAEIYQRAATWPTASHRRLESLPKTFSPDCDGAGYGNADKNLRCKRQGSVRALSSRVLENRTKFQRSLGRSRSLEIGRRPSFAGHDVVDLVMAKKSLHRVNGTKQARRLHHMGPHRRKMLAATKRRTEPFVPEKILHKLAQLNLPPNPWVYEVCLRELLRGVNAT
jgi:hypothetical protein